MACFKLDVMLGLGECNTEIVFFLIFKDIICDISVLKYLKMTMSLLLSCVPTGSKTFCCLFATELYFTIY